MPLRLLAVVALVLGPLFALAPTFYPSLDLPWLPDAQLHLGVDLQGGMELWLAVQREHAAQDEIDDDTAYLRGLVGAQGFSVRPVHGSIEIRTDAPRSDVIAFVDDRLGSYDHVQSVDDVHRFKLSEARRVAIYERAVVHSVEYLSQRLEEMCIEVSTVERIGDRFIFVQLPGVVDLAHGDCA